MFYMGFQLYALIQVSRSIYPYITQINQKDLPIGSPKGFQSLQLHNQFFIINRML